MSEHASHVDYSGKKALVVENDKKALAILKEHLEGLKFEVASAASQAEAETVIQNQTFDLVITELILEFTDSGFLFCYKLKKAQPDCKAIILTNAAAKIGLHFELSSPDAREWIKADSILEKSIRAEQLDREIAKIMNR